MRNKKFLYGIMVIMLIVIVSAMAGQKANAQDRKTPEGVYKYYTTIEVQPGDTLWSIAGTYADSDYISRKKYIEEIQFTNRLFDSEIHSGDYLTVFYYSTEYKE